MPGTFIVGLILSPLLVLSRNIAQKPARRTRFPREKEIRRKALAAGFYGGTAIIVGGLLGYWTRSCLNNQNPWVWAIFYVVQGKHPWTRLALLGYWAMLASVSVAGWNRQLARSRRYRLPTKPGAAVSFIVPQPREFNGTDAMPVKNSNGGSPTSSVMNSDSHSGFSHRASDLFDAADKHVPTLGLNARRKFFHGLAVVMFAPGIAIDVSLYPSLVTLNTDRPSKPAFTHLAFSAAFSLFVFTEYVRYFALYPFGAVVHLFLNEFLDHKDSGTTILSHFYLLTGCAGPLWLEGYAILSYPFRSLSLTADSE
jgi:MFS family permease